MLFSDTTLSWFGRFASSLFIGVFVDIGVHQDGLVHISQLADRFVKNPAEVVKVQQLVSVMEVDLPRKRITLSMKANPEVASASVAKRSTSSQGESETRGSN